MKTNVIQCPDCGSNEYRCNAFYDHIAWSKQFMFTCVKCQGQFNFEDGHGLADERTKEK